MNSIRPSPLALTRALATALVVLATGCPTPQPPPVLPAPATIVSFTASPTTVAKGESVVLSWEVKDAETVTLSKQDGASVPGFESKLKGSLELQVDQNLLLLLSAQGPGGADSATVRITVEGSADELLLAALPEEIRAGETSTLLWSAPANLAVTIRDQSGQVLVDGLTESNGSRLVQPRFTTTYELETSVGKVQTTLAVAPHIFSFAPDKPAAEPGETVALTWSAGGGDRLVVRRGTAILTDTRDPDTITSGRVEEPAPPAVAEDGVLTYTLELHNGAHVTTSIREVYVGATPRFGEVNIPSLIAYDRPYSINWQAFKTDRVEISIDGDIYYVSPTATDAAEGSLTLNPPTQKVTLTLRATNKRGGEDVEVREIEPVRPPEIVAFAASTHAVANGGEPVVLTWEIPHAKRTVIKDDRNKTVAMFEDEAAVAGTFTHFPNRQTTYTVTSDNNFLLDGTLQSVTRSLAPVEVTTPATLLFDKQLVGVGSAVSVIGATVPGATGVRSSGGEFVDIKESGTPFNMGSSSTIAVSTITMPESFQMPLFGETVGGDTICVSPNGWMSFKGSSSCVTGSSDNSDGLAGLPAFAFAPYHDNLKFKSSNLDYYYQFDSTPVGRRLIVQWTDTELEREPGSIITFQVQLYENGGVVFAYGNVQLTATADASIGIRDGTSSGVGFLHPDSVIVAPQVIPYNIQLSTDVIPFPVAAKASGHDLTYVVAFAGGEIEISGSPEVIPANSLVVSEVLFLSTAPGGEYIEIVNRSQFSLDLGRIQLQLPNGELIQAPAGTSLAGGGILLFGQTADGGGRGVPVNVVYGTDPKHELPDTKGTIKVLLDGAPSSQAEFNVYLTNYTTTGAPDIATRFDAPSSTRAHDPDFKNGRSCPETEVFGAGPLKGSPGATSRPCFPYGPAERLPQGGFVSIAATGFRLNLVASASWAATDEGYAILPPPGMANWVPINFAGELSQNLSVFSNGVISRAAYPVVSDTGVVSKPSFSGNPSTPDYNSTSMLHQTIAPFWDDLDHLAPNAGIYVQRNDDLANPHLSHTVVSWEHSTPYAGPEYDLNFQVKFFDNGDLEFHYGDMLYTGTSSGTRHEGSEATVWIEDSLGFVAEAIKINAVGPKFESNSAYRFYYRPAPQ